MARGLNLVKRRQWAERMERFEGTKLTVAQFCKAEEVATASFYQWRRKLAEESNSATPGKGQRAKTATTKVKTLAFTPLHVSPPKFSGATILLADGTVIELGGDSAVAEKIISCILNRQVRPSTGGDSC